MQNPITPSSCVTKHIQSKLSCACLGERTFTNPLQLNRLNEAFSAKNKNIVIIFFIFCLSWQGGERCDEDAWLADSFRLLTFTGVHTTCHIWLKCSTLGDTEKQSFHQSLRSSARQVPVGAKAHGKEGGRAEKENGEKQVLHMQLF